MTCIHKIRQDFPNKQRMLKKRMFFKKRILLLYWLTVNLSASNFILHSQHTDFWLDKTAICLGGGGETCSILHKAEFLMHSGIRYFLSWNLEHSVKIWRNLKTSYLKNLSFFINFPLMKILIWVFHSINVKFSINILYFIMYFIVYK